MDWLRVEGESMRPFLNPGEWVGVEWVSDRPPRLTPGQIVLGRHAEGNWVVHRYLGTGARPSLPMIKGDRSFAWDSLGEGEIWGIVRETKDSADSEATSLRVTFLDRAIAALSQRTIPPHRFHSRIFRKIIFALAWLRRVQNRLKL